MLDTLAFTKHLEAAGIDRAKAEAHAEAMAQHVLPDLATKADLAGLEHRLTMKLFAIVGGFNALLFGLLKLAGS